MDNEFEAECYNALAETLNSNIELHCDPRYLPPAVSIGAFFSQCLGLTSPFSKNAATPAYEGESAVFDTDSTPFAVDPCATATIINDKSHLMDLTPVENSFLTGVGGKIPVVEKETLMWNLKDDLGRRTSFVIKNAFNVPNAPHNLFCPQQWAMQHLEAHGSRDNPHFTTYASFLCLSWDEGLSSLTIPHDSKTNLPMWQTAPGFNSAAAFICTEIGKAFPSTLIEDDEDDAPEPPPASDDDTVQALDGMRSTPFPFHVTPHA